MNDLGLTLIGLAARSSAFAAIGLLLGLLVRRRGPSDSATVALATLVGMLGVSALSASPWPRIWTLGAGEATPSTAIAAPAPAPAVASGKIEPVGAEASAGSARPGPIGREPYPWLGPALQAFGRARVEPSPADRTGWRWPAWVAAAALAGVGLGLGRFGLGLAAVRFLRKDSIPVDDPEMLGLARAIEVELGLARPVALRLAPGLATPATVGWLRPTILLPIDWPGWDGRERRVVLAHEMAHIRRGDYLSGCLAQLSLALHFYHPLAHWLSGRLRLEQELAADAWGARLSGGNGPYLATLARLALRAEPRPVGWPARCSFRPARGTLLRRIEMLRDANNLRIAPLPRRARLVAVGALFLSGLALAGLRGPGSPGSAVAAPGPVPQLPRAAGGDPIAAELARGFIPADTAAILVVRPAELLARPEFRSLFDLLNSDGHFRAMLTVKPEEIEQITLLWSVDPPALPPGVARGPLISMPSGAIVRSTRPVDWKAFAARILGETEEAKIDDFPMLRRANDRFGLAAAWPDDRTLLQGQEPMLRRMVRAEPGAADRAGWAAAFKAVKKGQLAAALDATWLFNRLNQGNEGRPAGPSPFGPFEPLLDKANAYALGIDLGETVTIDGLAICRNEAGAGQVADTLKAAITLGRNALEALQAQAPKARASKILPILADGSALLAKMAVTPEGKAVRFGSKSEIRVAETLKLLNPAVGAAREAARRAQSVNNLKQIGLALHNYASAHDSKFPAAVMIAPDGKTRYSWRVAILPYLEQQPLYDAYRFDEPWDGPNNRKLIATIPATFRHPADEPGTSASYFVLTGNSTLFPGTQAVGFAEMTDGTSNTIAVVEAKRDIPWTKPEDIDFDPAVNAPLLKLGGYEEGGFDALFADGSVKHLKQSIHPLTLRALVTRNGGEVVSSDAY